MKNNDKRVAGIHYNEWLDYPAVLKHVAGCNCIVEVVSEGQVGVTMRCMEAIIYNKKLLTNNRMVSELPQYNPKYIKIFDNPDDIDVDFVKTKTVVNYHYKGEFSPIHLIDHINRVTKEKNQEI